jgi:hypothetical protein
MPYPTRYKYLPGRRYLFVDVLIGAFVVLSTVVLPLVIVWDIMMGGN